MKKEEIIENPQTRSIRDAKDRIHIPVDVVSIDTVREEIREQVLREAIPI